SEILAMEKEVMGAYLSDHPLRGYERIVSTIASHPCASIAELEEGTSVRLAGVLAGVRTIVTKLKGEKMATLTLEDLSGQASVIAFPKTYLRIQDRLRKDSVIKVQGVVIHRERTATGEKLIEVRLEEIEPLEAQLEFSRASS